ncbi:MAG TPA: kinase [Candidatus Paceibacterota bacterium]|nr:kinase [Verrucomicrobiota bacterium]HSA12064.1 kinase [Candidatus Paceibacterota bacterium]
MVISRTPYRISFFGGGTDYPAWYRQHGGCVLAATINKYCYLTCRYLPPFFEHRTRVMYSIIEMCQTVEEIQHPSVRETLRYLKIDRGMEIHHDGDLPSRSGMGSSSAFTVGLFHALTALKGQIVSKKQLASEAIYLEQEVLKETVGSQDQVCAAYGGVNRITFLQNGGFSVQPLTLSHARLGELNSHLMLFYTGVKRTASDIAASYASCADKKRVSLLRRMQEYVDQSSAVLGSDQDIIAFGELLHQTWLAKRGLSDKVSNPRVDALYEAARSAGAIGGKLLGAGGGGFLLFFVPPERQKKVRQQLSKLIHVPFEFEFSGSQIIFFDLEEDFARHDKVRARQQIEAFREWNAEPPRSPA